jgi:hypothetical protein
MACLWNDFDFEKASTGAGMSPGAGGAQRRSTLRDVSDAIAMTDKVCNTLDGVATGSNGTSFFHVFQTPVV